MMLSRLSRSRNVYPIHNIATFLRRPYTPSSQFHTSFALSQQQQQQDAEPLLESSAESPTLLSKRTPSSNASIRHKMRKELEYLQDPWKLALNVESQLAKGQIDEAMVLTQMASKDMAVTVAWNHIIDYLFQKQKLHAAFRAFNDMKKRGQLPNAQTYTIIFKGCARSQHPALSVAEAVKLYNNMLSGQRMEPNIVHLNAVLSACARAGDIESMLSIANTADNKLRSPNAITYCSILNGLRASVEAENMRQRHQSSRSSEAIPLALRKENINKTVERAKNIWEEVIRKWRGGKLLIDESLVCAMGRILRLGNVQDKLQIFPLLHQTMNIPLFGSDTSSSLPGPRAKRLATPSAADTSVIISENRDLTREPLYPSTPPGLIVPGKNTLSLILSILHSTRRTSLALPYWNHLVEKRGVQPDAANWHDMLLALKRGHASSRAAEIVRIMPEELMSAKTFRLAMQTCLGDKINPSVNANANAILDVMLSIRLVPDMESLRDYLEVSLYRRRPADTPASTPTSREADIAYGAQITSSLARMFPGYTRALDAVKLATKRADDKNWGEVYNQNREVIALARRMIGAYDKVVTERLVESKDELEKLAKKRNSLNYFVTEFYQRRAEFEPKMKMDDDKSGKGRRETRKRREDTDRRAVWENEPGEANV